VPYIHEILGNLVLPRVQTTAGSIILHGVQELLTKYNAIIRSKN